MDIQILKCGLPVIIKQANLKGIITCASIRFDKTTYEVTYYVSGEQKTVWVNEAELEFSSQTDSQLIGFK